MTLIFALRRETDRTTRRMAPDEKKVVVRRAIGELRPPKRDDAEAQHGGPDGTGPRLRSARSRRTRRRTLPDAVWEEIKMLMADENVPPRRAAMRCAH